jgi:hypothetical protein
MKRTLVAATALALASCGDSGDTEAVEDAQYVVASRVFSSDGSMVNSYFELTPSLEVGFDLHGDNAIEVGGSAKLFSLPEYDWLAIGDGEQPVITRYAVEDGELVAGESVSLSSFGVDSLWDTLYPVSADKVYYPDRANGQLIIINPREMIVEGTIDLGETVRDGYLALYSYSAIKRGDKLLFSVGWFDWDTDRVGDDTGLVVIDTKRDRVERFDVDERCGGVTTPVTVATGDTYYVSSALAAAADVIGRPSSKPCALRILKGKDTFDDSYALDLNEVSDGAPVGEPIPGDKNEIVLRALDEDELEGEPAESWEVTSQLAWSWWRWDVATGESSRIEELPLSTSDVVWFQVDGRTIGSQTEADYSSTTLLDMSATPPETLLTVHGFASGVARVP